MELWQNILERFDYDLWANRLWLENLKSKGFPEPDAKVFGHLVSAQSLWLTRCQGNSLDRMPELALEDEVLVRLSKDWKTHLVSEAQDREVSYHRLNGQELSMPLSQIAWHVLNHGTYHRGELRGLCRARGDEEFPETDLGRFYFEVG